MNRAAACILIGVGGWMLACASSARSPTAVRDYEVIVPARDTFSVAMAVELERAGVRVRRQPRAGGQAPAVLVWYEFREAGQGGRHWLYARLFHARSSAVVAAARLPEDSLLPGGADRARLLVHALLLPVDTALTIEDTIP